MSKTGRLAGKTAVVTGSSSGIGAATAQLFAAEGARVVINYRHSEQRCAALLDTIRAAGGQAEAVQADVADTGQIEHLLGQSRQLLGDIDIWANFAGADILTGAGATLSDSEKLKLLMEVDLRGTIQCCWAVAPVMQQQGHGCIVNMSWDLVTHGMQGINPQMFAAVKAGVMGFSKCLARHYAPQVRVNDVAPGWIETAFAEQEMQPDYYQAVIEQTPMRRFGKPGDVAAAALYLVSDEASFISGQTLRVNGGLV